MTTLNDHIVSLSRLSEMGAIDKAAAWEAIEAATRRPQAAPTLTQVAKLQDQLYASVKPFRPIPLDQMRAEVEASMPSTECSFCLQPVWRHWHRNRSNTEISDPDTAARFAECEYPRSAAIEREYERRVVEQTGRLLSGESAANQVSGGGPAAGLMSAGTLRGFAGLLDDDDIRWPKD